MLNFYGTLGPSCGNVPTLSALLEQGMTGVRLNLSHAGLEACGKWLDDLSEACVNTGREAQLLIDLQGPELRVGGSFSSIPLKENGEAILYALGETPPPGAAIPIPPALLEALEKGQELLLDDGAILLCCQNQVVMENGIRQIPCIVLRGGTLLPRKSIAAPGCALSPPTLTAEDLHNLSLAASYGVTGVMLPFVRNVQDLQTLRKVLEKEGAPHIQIFAKLENRAGVEMLSELLADCDAVVIARGDLGNDIPLWELPAAQKRIAALCRQAEKPFMVVTQMLHSMQKASVPTRAEVSDIFNAVLDGASSLMLTGETAAGAYPVESMGILCRTAAEALNYQRECLSSPKNFHNLLL